MITSQDQVGFIPGTDNWANIKKKSSNIIDYNNGIKKPYGHLIDVEDTYDPLISTMILKCHFFKTETKCI